MTPVSGPEITARPKPMQMPNVPVKEPTLLQFPVKNIPKNVIMAPIPVGTLGPSSSNKTPPNAQNTYVIKTNTENMYELVPVGMSASW